MSTSISTKACSRVHRRLEAFAGITSLHGVPRIINATSLQQRVFWSLVFVCAVSMFVLTGTNLLSMYFSYPKKVNVEIVQKPVPFPSVTVCNTEHLDIMVAEKMRKIFTTEDAAPLQDEKRKKSVNSRKVKADSHMKDKDGGGGDGISSKDEAAFLESYSVFQSTLSVLMQTASLGSGSGGVDMRDVFELMSRMGLVANVGPTLSSRASISASDFIVYCRFMEEECNLTETFVKIFDPYFFNCFTFEPNQIAKSTRLAGIEHGLTLLLFPGSAGMISKGESDMTMIPGMIEGDAALATNQGAKVVIHAQDSIPHFTTDGVDISSGASVSIGIRARLNVRISLPHGNCTHENEKDIGRRKRDSAKAFRYTLISCQNECIQANIAKSCGCVDSRMPYREKDLLRHQRNYLKHRQTSKSESVISPSVEKTKNSSSYLPFCLELPTIPKRCRKAESMVESADCWEIVKKMGREFNSRTKCRKVVYDKMTIKQPELIEACRCHPPCEDVAYDASHSVAKLPEKLEENSAFYSVVDRYLEALSAERRNALQSIYGSDYISEVKRRICRLNVHIADNNIIKTTESPDYDIVRLVSDIGGQMGLWIGISVITLVEVLQLFADLCGVISHATKKLWRLYVKGKEDDSNPSSPTDSKNIGLVANRSDKDFNTISKMNNVIDTLNQNKLKERYFADEINQSNEYFLNKLTTV